MSNEISAEFTELAQSMAQNYVYLSVKRADFPSASQYFFKSGAPPFPPKIVAVVGAGASADACGLPTGREAASQLKKTLEKDFPPDAIGREIHRITVEYRLEESDFETVLLALSKFDQITILNELNKIYNRRHYPSLMYELLAHWMKHRFVDAVVNFNFDELLDQALDDELGPKGYYRVVMDGDCPEKPEDWFDNETGRFKFPLYIKPHGTASNKSTMRFTRSAYSLLPRDLDTLLVELFRGSTDVLIAGYAMQSVEFNDVLARSRDKMGGDDKLRFFAFANEKPDVSSQWKMYFTDTTAEGLGPWFEKLSKAVSANFKSTSPPRTICRHNLVAEIFQRKAVLNQDQTARDADRKSYLRDRVYVEISLAVAKAKGFVSLDHLARGRAGRYFNDLRRHAGTSANDSMITMCSDLGLSPFGYWDTLCLPQSQADAARNRLRCPILEDEEFQRKVPELVDATFNRLSAERQGRHLIKSVLQEAFMELYKREEVEVSNDVETAINASFARPTALTTLASLHAQTNKMIQSDGWDSILCAAETGQWLLHWSETIKRKKARLALIVADETYKKSLQDVFREELGDRLRWLPWWLHNRHITVLLNGIRVVQAVYFERRLRTSHIVPMWLEGDDAEMAIQAFVGYWIKSAHHKNPRRDDEIQYPEIEKERNRLIGELAKPIHPRVRKKGNAE